MTFISNPNPLVSNIDVFDPLFPNLSTALDLVEEGLQHFVTSPDFLSSMILVFDESHDYSAFGEIFTEKSTDVLNLVEIVPSVTLQSAYGAFSRDTDKIYLTSDYINLASPSALASVILEEYGHYIDAQLNPVETVGDEGEIFADLVQGNPINPAAFTEDDTAVININGNWITVEQAQGDLDPSFGGGTGVTVSPYTSSQIGGIVVQPDGKILVATTIDRSFGVIRFNSDGTLDPTFGGGDGLVTTTVFPTPNIPHGIALQTDGKILIAGAHDLQATLISYNSDGTLDTSFNGDGIITLDGNSARVASNFQTIAIQPNGKIVVGGGLTTFVGGNVGVIYRFNLDGSVDASFDADRLSGNSVTSLAIQSDGKIIAGDERGFLARLNPNGSFDSSWSGDGRISLNDLTNGFDELGALALQPDGKLLVAASYKDPETDTISPLFARFNPDGTLDTSFADGEGAFSPLFVFDSNLSQDNPIKGLTLQADGKFLVTAELDNRSIGLARFDSDGFTDFDFGNFGTLTIPLENDEDENLVLQPNGQILVAGLSNGFVSVARYIGFEPAQYGASYGDLIGAFGYNLQALSDHYFNSGRYEGRVTDNFGEFRYIASNPDLITAFGANGTAATEHYIRYGFGEGRSLSSFDAARYLASYNDLRTTFFFNFEAASQHYAAYGFAEGRNPNLFPTDRYIASYPDLVQAFRYNLEAGSNHYLFSGRGEGRQVLFNPQAYLNRYGDLQAAFGTNLDAATQHYIVYGLDEGRTWM